MLCFGFSFSQQALVINEFDPDTPSTDTAEFIELKSEMPNFPTDGYVLVFFNGSSSGEDRSYFSFSLDGLSTDNNGLLVIGGSEVSPYPQAVISDNSFQNGADAVGIYEGTEDDFPGGTLATMVDLVDAMVYGTNDTVDADLLGLLGETIQYNDNGTDANPRSIQRFVDGMGIESYTTATPTPRRENDGSGISINLITISVPQEQYNEGENFTITFTAEENVTSNLTFNISLNNGGFNTGDFSGSTSITIPNGQNTATTFIVLLDDPNDEGDEVLEISFTDLTEPIVAGNNAVQVRVVDNDFTMAPWNLPTENDLGVVQNNIPSGYYDTLNGLVDNDLRDAIEAIIADPTVVRVHPYADVIEILNEADQNPNNSNQVWLVYSEEGRPKLDVQTGSSSSGKWNREHTFPRSRGGFNDWEDFDDIPTGITNFIIADVDSTRHANSDAHALRAADASENSRRGNRHYSQNTYDADEYNGPSDSGNLGSWKGDVARGVLFLELRYNGLQVVNGLPSSSPTGNLGDLATLLQWHTDDPPDDFERNRNNVIYNWQRNRNPLIDMPDLVDYIWGSRVGETWTNTLNVNSFETETVTVFPNPSNGKVMVQGVDDVFDAELYTLDGKLIKSMESQYTEIDLGVDSGLYILKLVFAKGIVTKKISVR